MTLPPGQREVKGFPRFGTHLHLPPPSVPTDPALEICGAVGDAYTVRIADLQQLTRTAITADFHCVAGWSATDLAWEGVSFVTFFSEFVEPRLDAGVSVSHVVVRGLDDYSAVLCIEDALGEDVLLADQLDGQPLDPDHGAPLRFVSPQQYGFMNTKHVCGIEFHTEPPSEQFGGPTPLARAALRSRLIWRHPRARVWNEERHPLLPPWFMRRVYRVFIPQITFLSQRGSVGPSDKP